MNIIGLYSKQSKYTGFPQYYDKARGIEITSGGKKYQDWSSMSVGCNLLGYNNPHVNYKVINRVNRGANSSLVCKDEIELSKMLLEDHPQMDQVRYTRTGGEALKIALDLARTYTGSEDIVTCGYHGHHIKNMKLRSVNFNDHEALWSYHPKIFIFEPIRNSYPSMKWIETLQILKKINNCVIIVDEVTSGYRFNYGPYYPAYQIEPDLVVVGKGISNGYPLAAIIGKAEFMSQNYFISSTYFTDGLSCAAAVETLKHLRKKQYCYLQALGQAVKTIYNIIAKSYGHVFLHNETDSIVDIGIMDARVRAGLTSLLVEDGILHNGLYYPSFAHKPKDFNNFDSKIKKAFNKLSKMDLNQFELIEERPVVVR